MHASLWHSCFLYDGTKKPAFWYGLADCVKRQWCICGESIPLFSFFISSHEDWCSAHLNSLIYWLVCFPKIVQETDQENLKLFSHILTCLLMSCYSCLANLFTIHRARRHFCSSVRCCLTFLIILVWVRFSMSLVQEPIRHVLSVKFKISIACPVNWYKKSYSSMQKTRLPSAVLKTQWSFWIGK